MRADKQLLWAPTDIEGHRGSDGRFYVVRFFVHLSYYMLFSDAQCVLVDLVGYSSSCTSRTTSEELRRCGYS